MRALLPVLPLLVGCAISQTSTGPTYRTMTAEERRTGELAAQEEHRRQSEEIAAHHAAVKEANRRRRDEEKALAAKSEVDDCARDRAERLAEMQRQMDSEDHVAGLREWEAEHCHWEDNAKQVVRVRQDHRGEIHLVEVPDRGVDRVCDAKKPKEIETTYSRFLTVYRMPVETSSRNSTCRKLDLPASQVAEAYWGRR